VAAAPADPELELFQRYRRDGDRNAREAIIERWLPLARSLARRYAGGREPFDDLVQVASIGLIKAVDRFDPDRGYAFTSFAVPTIVGDLKRHFRDSAWPVHVPRGMQERVFRLRRARERLTLALGRAPRTRELAAELGMSVKDVLAAREAALVYRELPLESPPGADADDDEAGDIAAVLGVTEHRYETVDQAQTIAPVVRALSDREREILLLRFGKEMTQAEIAAELGISQMHVSRLLRRSLARIRVSVERDGRAAA
jgi:RNA polymerase sigma-B factor